METTFETRAQRRARKRQERKLEKPARSMKWLWIVVAVVLVGGIVAWTETRPKPTPAQKVAQASKSHEQLVLSCTTDAATTFHIHSHLSIIINGEDQSVPADIGVTSSCLHPLHTHDSAAIIHMESPVKEDFTIADFFKVWDKTYSDTKILGTTVDANHQLKLFVDKKEVTTGPGTIMKDRESISIIVAPKDQTITPPDSYSFPKSL